MLPPIRYPLPTLFVIVLLGLIIWRGEPSTRPLRTALAERWHRRTEGPPIPRSTRPQQLAGPVVRRGLLLRDDVPISDRPGGPSTEAVRLRMFVDIYDVWPLTGTPTHYRVGNRRPIGWASANDLLPWSTRLVVRAPGANPSRDSSGDSKRPALPVLSWNADTIEVASWEESRPWQVVEARVRLPLASLPPEDWGVWISRPELLTLLRKTGPDLSEPPEVVRLRALIGRLTDDRPLTAAELAKIRGFLPAAVLPSHMPVLQASEALARANENWTPEATWSGISFQFLPLSMLP